MGCQHPVPLTAGAALDQFCHHGTVTSGRDASPDHYQLCMEHYRVESELRGFTLQLLLLEISILILSLGR
jgi:hypothetical protein